MPGFSLGEELNKSAQARAKVRQISDAISQRDAIRRAYARDLPSLPDVADPERRAACKSDLTQFCRTYFPAAFTKPFCADHLRVIEKIEHAVLHGGLFALAMPRGSGKTTLSACAALWSVLYGHHKFVVIIGAEAKHATELADSIKIEIETNDLLFSDFPEAAYPIAALDRSHAKAQRQTYQGEATRIKLSRDFIALPTIPESQCSGAVIAVTSILGRIRGMKQTHADGAVLRPSFVIIDDPQTRRSAKSDTQTEDRSRVINGDILGLAGPGKRISAVCPCTIIYPDDLAAQLLDRSRNPEWRGVTTKMVYQWPTHDQLWEKYADIRREESLEDAEDFSRSNDFYVKNRELMDQGAAVAWDERYDEDEISAIQHAWNLRIRMGEEAFFAELQNEPLIKEDEHLLLSPRQIAEKINGYEEGEIPENCEKLVVGVDVQEKMLYWVLVAFEMNFTGYVVAYGAWPKQRTRYFHLHTASKTLKSVFPGYSQEARIYAAIEKFTQQIMAVPWMRDDGAIMKISRIMIDANWAQMRDTVYSACRQLDAPLTPCHGRWVGPEAQPISHYKKGKGQRVGNNWYMPSAKGAQKVRHIIHDTGYWKDFFHRRLATPKGESGCLTLFKDRPKNHLMFGEHCRAETRDEITSEKTGRTAVAWREKPHKPDNHLFDGAVLACVGASHEGVELPVMAGKQKKKSKIKLSSMQGEKRE